VPVLAAALADALALFLTAQGLARADLVGTSLGGRLVLEMVRRGVGRHVVALDPGGYWNGPERMFVMTSLRASIATARRLRPVLPLLAGNPVTRTPLIAQFSARPWAVPGDAVLRELRGLAGDPGVDPALASLAAEPAQRGVPTRTTQGRVVIGWGRWDRLTLPTQARRALAAFPGATLHRFAHSGHFPMFDSPDETVRVVLDATG
jgi:pimeloyl-ACP methyl ester carboxylesterase